MNTFFHSFFFFFFGPPTSLQLLLPQKCDTRVFTFVKVCLNPKVQIVYLPSEYPTQSMLWTCGPASDHYFPECPVNREGIHLLVTGTVRWDIYGLENNLSTSCVMWFKNKWTKHSSLRRCKCAELYTQAFVDSNHRARAFVKSTMILNQKVTRINIITIPKYRYL